MIEQVIRGTFDRLTGRLEYDSNQPPDDQTAKEIAELKAAGYIVVHNKEYECGLTGCMSHKHGCSYGLRAVSCAPPQDDPAKR